MPIQTALLSYPNSGDAIASNNPNTIVSAELMHLIIWIIIGMNIKGVNGLLLKY